MPCRHYMYVFTVKHRDGSKFLSTARPIMGTRCLEPRRALSRANLRAAARC